MTELSADDIEALAVGAWILGTGGGGSPYHGLLNMRRLYREGLRVTLMDPITLADDDEVAVVSYMGAPLVTQERLVDSRLIARSVELMEGYLGRKFRGVMAIEIGGGNSIQPLMAAAHLGIPVIDADAMGRAYPEAQMTTFAVGDLSPAPLTSVDPRGNEVIVSRVASWSWMERTSRKVCTEFGSIAATCKAPRTGARSEALGDSPHDHKGHPPRQDGHGCEPPPPGPDRRPSWKRSKANGCSLAKSWRSSAERRKGSCAARRRSKASGTSDRHRLSE